MYGDRLVIFIDGTPRAQTISKVRQEFSKLGCSEAQVTKSHDAAGRMETGPGGEKGKVGTPPPTRAALLLLIYESSVKV